MSHVLDHRWLARNGRTRWIDGNAQRCDVVGVHVIFASALVIVADDILANIIVDVGAKLRLCLSAAGKGDDHQDQNCRNKNKQQISKHSPTRHN